MAEKPRNDPRREIQWGLLLIGFALGALVMVLVMPERVQTVVATATETLDPIWVTATAIYLLQMDSLTAHPRTPSLFEHPPLFTSSPTSTTPQITPILLTMTRLYRNATETDSVRRTLTAESPYTAPPIDPIWLTATSIYQMQIAGNTAHPRTPGPIIVGNPVVTISIADATQTAAQSSP